VWGGAFAAAVVLAAGVAILLDTVVGLPVVVVLVAAGVVGLAALGVGATTYRARRARGDGRLRSAVSGCWDCVRAFFALL